MSGKVMTGARAVVKVDQVVVGIFDSCQYGANLGTEAIHILGRFSPDEIAITSYEAIQVACSGFRIIGQGYHKLPKAPKLADLLTMERVQLEILDRQTKENIMVVVGCVPSSWGEAQQAKGSTRFNITYIGLRLSDEEGMQDETNDPSFLP